MVNNIAERNELGEVVRKIEKRIKGKYSYLQLQEPVVQEYARIVAEIYELGFAAGNLNKCSELEENIGFLIQLARGK